MFLSIAAFRKKLEERLRALQDGLLSGVVAFILRLVFITASLIVLRLAFAALFIRAGLAKLHSSASFENVLLRYDALPESLIPATATTVPWLEILAGTAILAGFHRRGGLAAIWVLCAAFTILVASVLWRGIETECGCSFKPQMVTTATLVRNVLLLAAASVLLRYRRWPLAVDERLAARADRQAPLSA